VGDIVVGKHIGKLMASLGGRLGAYRATLAGEGSFEDALRRNVTLVEDRGPELLAERLLALRSQLDTTAASGVLAGSLAR
jgi:cytochrome b pre-mRNA-processing protein 3